MALLTKDAILAAAVGKSTDVAVPELGGSVRVRMLSGTERDALFADLSNDDGKIDMRRYRINLVALCVVDETGAALLGVDDVVKLDEGCAPAVVRLFAAAQGINGLLPDAVGVAQGN